MHRRIRLLWIALPLIAGAVLALLWVRATGGTPLMATLRDARPGPVALMLGVTAGWLAVRFIRWQFLLRRVGIRVPIRPSLSVYLAGLPGTATPAYVGEALRSVFLRRRFGAPLRITLGVLVIERLYDVAALAILAAAFGGDTGLRVGAGFFLLAAVGAAVLGPILRRAGIAHGAIVRLRAPATFIPATLLSLVAWFGAAMLYALAGDALGAPLSAGGSATVFTHSTLLGALTLAPAGFGATGSIAILRLQDFALSLTTAVTLVTLVRLTSTGAALAAGTLFLWREWRWREPVDEGVAHFDTIAEEYSAQWSPHVWDLLLDRKLTLMGEALAQPPAAAGVGLDLGCGLGIQTSEMQRRGYQVIGVEPSVGLLRQKRSGAAPVVAGDALHLPVRDASVDFVFVIGVLHHLPGREAQEAALREVARVLKPGGRLLVHESNPRNPLFRFYMGYLFPILKSIDEGTEWWIDPRQWAVADGFRLSDVRYFTFLPDFTPRALMRPALAVERWLERGPTRAWSAHYMAVLERAAAPAEAPDTLGVAASSPVSSSLV